MNNKKISILILLATLVSSTVIAQRGFMHKRVEAYRIAYLTEKLDLSPEEAQIFWPVFNEFRKKEDSLRHAEHKAVIATPNTIDEMNDKQLEDFVDRRIIHAQQMLEIKKQYHQKFKEILPIKKVARLYVAEKEFKKYLLSKLGKGHHGGKGRHRGGPMPDEF